MTEENKNVKNFPNLRFPGFEGVLEKRKLEELIQIQSGFAFKSEYFIDNGNKLVIPKNFTKYGYGNFDDNISKFSQEQPPKQYKCKEGDLLILLTDLTPSCELLGKPLLLKKEDGEVWLNQRIIKLHIEDLKLKNWLFYYFQTEDYLKIIKETSTGSTVRHSSNKIINQLQIFIPNNPEEQQKISSFITLVDSRIQTQKKIIEQLETLMKASRENIFSQKLRFKNEQGNYFSDWDLTELKNVCFIIGGGTPDTHKSEFWNGNIQWFTPTEIKSNFVFKSERTISELGLKNSSAKILPQGCILLTTRATIGEVAIAQEECTTNQGFQSLVVRENCNNIFLFHWIKENKFELIKRANGSTFPEISKSEIELIKISLPSLEEQTKIANFLSSIQEKIETEKQILEKLELQKKFLLSNLFI
ncbi:restriction endonuclease subunit S [Elizabethkingia anophelis]|nr:restriction endonuclease subunit S [Elizabethkingia anophelis]